MTTDPIKPRSTFPDSWGAEANALIDKAEEFYKRELPRAGTASYSLAHDFGPGGHHVTIRREDEIVWEFRSDVGDDPALVTYVTAILRRLSPAPKQREGETAQEFAIRANRERWP